MTHPYPSLLRYCLSKAVSASASDSEHRADVRTTVPAVQVRGEYSFGARRGSLLAQLGPRILQTSWQHRSRYLPGFPLLPGTLRNLNPYVPSLYPSYVRVIFPVTSGTLTYPPCTGAQTAVFHLRSRPRWAKASSEPAPWRHILGALRDMSSSLD